MPKGVTSTGCLEASATSLHSSGQDSGIVARACNCGHSSTPSSADSSNGYEDSLKSLHRSQEQISRGPEAAATSERQTVVPSGRQRFHSFSNGESIYGRDTSLRREMRYRTNTEKRQQGHPEPIHVSRTMIRESHGVGIDKQGVARLRGAAGSSHSLFW
uniref:Add protein n=2 Tax=Fopius arisanus TaxID=64838 RepID=A0A0C9QQ15_9HYME